MGIVLWLGCGFVAWALARIIPAGRRGWMAEGFVAMLAAFGCGVAATAMDFGGWKEPDWRAGAFAFFGALAAAGIIRAARIDTRRSHAAPVDAAPEDPRRAGS